jgi:opine dehydrogenase
MTKKINISVLGAGNGGQAIAAHCSMKGFGVCLYNRTLTKISALLKEKIIKLCGAINGNGKIDIITDDIKQAVEFADIIMIVTTANAHKDLALKMAPYLKENQIVVLNPGRTGGLLEFKTVLKRQNFKKHIYLAEAQTLVYACRIIEDGLVNIIGIKDKVLLSSDNSVSTNYIIEKLSDLYTCFIPAKNVLQTSFENIGAIFHPCVVLFNAAAIERGESFYFYRDMTKQVAQFIQQVDNERINIGKAFGIDLITAEDWIAYAYPNIKGNNLCDRMKNNPAYYDILAPTSIYSRQLLEDIPTGLFPMMEFGKLANVNVELMTSIINICSALLNLDIRKDGRTLDKLGLDQFSKENIICKYLEL